MARHEHSTCPAAVSADCARASALAGERVCRAKHGPSKRVMPGTVHAQAMPSTPRLPAVVGSYHSTQVMNFA